MNYKQCTLQHDAPDSVTRLVTWIDARYARLGNNIRLKDDSRYWAIIEVSSVVVDERHLPDSHSAIKAHKKKTGDSLPKHRLG